METVFKLGEELVVEDGGVRYTFKTTINAKLQSYIDRMLNRSKTLQAAVVVLNPHDGTSPGNVQP